MLKPEKRKALEAIVGKDVAEKLLSSLKSTEEEASTERRAYKSFDDSAVADIVGSIMDSLTEKESELLGTSEKCTPGTKDGKYKAETEKAEDEEDDMEEDDEEEMEEDEEEDESESSDDMLLTEAEMKSIAKMIAGEMKSTMQEMKAMLTGMEKKMAGTKKKSADSDITESFKEYLSKQDEVNIKMLETFEEIDTRLKAIESTTGIGYIASKSSDNVVDTLNLQPPERNAFNLWFGDNK